MTPFEIIVLLLLSGAIGAVVALNVTLRERLPAHDKDTFHTILSQLMAFHKAGEKLAQNEIEKLHVEMRIKQAEAETAREQALAAQSRGHPASRGPSYKDIEEFEVPTAQAKEPPPIPKGSSKGHTRTKLTTG